MSIFSLFVNTFNFCRTLNKRKISYDFRVIYKRSANHGHGCAYLSNNKEANIVTIFSM